MHTYNTGADINESDLGGSHAAELPVEGEERTGATSQAQERNTATVIRADEVKAKAVEWLWPGRVPKHAITVLAGDPGLGKSMLSVWLAAQVSQGRLGEEPADVVMLNAEDAVAQVVRPRLEAAGAELTRIHFVTVARSGLPTPLQIPDDMEVLSRVLADTHAALIVVDPLMAHLSGRIDSWKDQKVREALAPLQGMADQTGTAVLVVAHLNKGQGTDPLQRLGGSIGIPAAARSVLLLGRDPDEPGSDGRVVAHAKSNVGPLAQSLVFTLNAVAVGSSGLEVARMTQAGRSRHRAVDLLAVDLSIGRSKLERAVEFLMDALAEGPAPAKELAARAKEAGISDTTLGRAKERLGVQSEKAAFGGGWEWALPDAVEAEAA